MQQHLLQPKSKLSLSGSQATSCCLQGNPLVLEVCNMESPFLRKKLLLPIPPHASGLVRYQLPDTQHICLITQHCIYDDTHSCLQNHGTVRAVHPVHLLPRWGTLKLREFTLGRPPGQCLSPSTPPPYHPLPMFVFSPPPNWKLHQSNPQNGREC